MTPNFEGLLRALYDARVEFVVIGGVAATLHGSARATYDLDLLYSRSPQNLGRLATALAPLSPYLRGAPPGLPFRWDEATIGAGLNFTLTTAVGDIDLLGEIAGGGTYDALRDQTLIVSLFGMNCLCLSLDALIHTKRAAGRPKDLEVIAELEAIREETRSR